MNMIEQIVERLKDGLLQYEFHLQEVFIKSAPCMLQIIVFIPEEELLSQNVSAIYNNVIDEIEKDYDTFNVIIVLGAKTDYFDLNTILSDGYTLYHLNINNKNYKL